MMIMIINPVSRVIMLALSDEMTHVFRLRGKCMRHVMTPARLHLDRERKVLLPSLETGMLLFLCN